jgi:hypothetical protein
MIAPRIAWLRLPTSFLLITLAAGCGDHTKQPAPPETGDPAPPPAVSAQEDRGNQAATETAAPDGQDSAFTNVDSGDEERAASKRGHESAGEPAPAAPGSSP